MAKIENLGNSLFSPIFCKAEVEKKGKEKLICPMFLFKMTQSKIVFGKNLDLIFSPPKGQKVTPQNPFLRKSQFWGWIMMVNFHAKMCVFRCKSIFMPKYGRKCEG